MMQVARSETKPEPSADRLWFLKSLGVAIALPFWLLFALIIKGPADKRRI